MRHLDLFSGIGGFALAARSVWKESHEIVGFSDNDAFCRNVLRKNFPNAPIYGDIRELTAERLAADAAGLGRGGMRRTQDERTYAGFASRHHADRCDHAPRVDLLTGGFPCQPFSNAGKKRGREDDRYLWPQMLRIVRETRPAWILGENVAGIVAMALDQVCADLEREGYAVQPFIIPAAAVGAPHRRDRVWIVARAHAGSGGWNGRQDASDRQLRREGSDIEGENTGVSSGPNPNDTNTSSSRLQKSGQARERQLQTKDEKRIYDRPEFKNRHDSHASSGRQRQEHPDGGGSEPGDRTQRPVRIGSPIRPFQRSQWRRDWREVALATCHAGVDARIPQWMDVLLGRLNYASSYPKIADQKMRALLQALQEAQVQWPTGGRDEIPTKTFLLRTLRWLQARRDPARLLLQRGSAEIPKETLRKMRDAIEAARSSCGRGSVEKRARELADALRFLPCEIALAITQSWDDIRILQDGFKGVGIIAAPDGSTLSEARWRREALKAYGNAIVPQVAAEIMMTMKKLGL